MSVFVGAGYSAPAPPQVAPGQVLVLFYRAVGLAEDGKPRSGHVEPPLPTLVAGLSAQVRQGNSLWNVAVVVLAEYVGGRMGSQR